MASEKNAAVAWQARSIRDLWGDLIRDEKKKGNWRSITEEEYNNGAPFDSQRKNAWEVRALYEHPATGILPEAWNDAKYLAAIMDTKYGPGISFNSEDAAIAFAQFFAIAQNPTP